MNANRGIVFLDSVFALTGAGKFVSTMAGAGFKISLARRYASKLACNAAGIGSIRSSPKLIIPPSGMIYRRVYNSLKIGSKLACQYQNVGVYVAEDHIYFLARKIGRTQLVQAMTKFQFIMHDFLPTAEPFQTIRVNVIHTFGRIPTISGVTFV